MIYSDTKFDNLLILKTKHFSDHRGQLNKFFYSDFFNSYNFNVDDVYTTVSHKNVIRGLHHQKMPFGQVKLVSCLAGSFMDVAVDLRRDSNTFGEFFSYKLTAGSEDALLIPAGFSHGTYSLEDGTTMLSICSGRYLPAEEAGIDMKSLSLPFSTSNAIVSEKDQFLPSLSSLLSQAI